MATNFDLTNTEWYKVENLEDDTVYFLQGKREIEQAGSGDNKIYTDQIILFTQSESEPTEQQEGILVVGVKFKKASGKNVYIRAVYTKTNIQIEES